jgi:hypothetical protein
MEYTNAELAEMYGLTEEQIEGYRRLAKQHLDRKPVEWWLDFAAKAGKEFRKSGDEITARKIMEGLESEGRATDADREAFKEYLESIKP